MAEPTVNKLAQEKAGIVLSEIGLNQDGSKPLDSPAIIELLFGILTDLFKECGNNAERSVANAKDPGFLQRFRLRRYVREALGDDLYQNTGENVLKGLYKLGRNVNKDEFKILLEETKK